MHIFLHEIFKKKLGEGGTGFPQSMPRTAHPLISKFWICHWLWIPNFMTIFPSNSLDSGKPLYFNLD